MDYLVEMRNITKKFSGITVLDDVHFNLLPGEVHILLGENGAGKSTLTKLISGVYTPTSGEIIIKGDNYSKLTPQESQKRGISVIYQELSVIDELTITENIFVGRLLTKKILGKSFVDFKEMRIQAEKLLKAIGLNRDPSDLVGDLKISEKQQVEIIKAISSNANIIIMDEPTSSLTTEEVKNLFKIIHSLKEKGIGIIYISHKLRELKEIGDRVTVLKDGKWVGTKNLGEIEIKDLVSMMVGRELDAKFVNTDLKIGQESEVFFEVKGLTRADNKVQNIDFKLYKGEVLGFAGLIGSGRTELMQALFGVDKIKTGEIYLKGKKIVNKTPYQAIKQGMALITESRRETGFFHNFAIWNNISIVSSLKKSRLRGIWGWIEEGKEKEGAQAQKKLLNIKCETIDQNIMELSGGNQQKVLIGKWMSAGSELFIFDEPTRGIDVGAKAEIYCIINKIVQEGKGIIIVSSELPELLAICNRIIVFSEGRIAGELSHEEATEEKIISYATTKIKE